MRKIPLTPETARIAKRIVWFEPPGTALSDPVRFMAYAMARACYEDMQAILKLLTPEDFIEALDRAPPGIVDARSWAYWNLVAGRYPAPPLPERRL